MRTIINGHSEDKTFLSNNLASLLEWCLNYKKPVYFNIVDTSNIYNVKIKYCDNCSEGRYNDRNYDCYLIVTFSDVNNKQIYYDALIVNSVAHTLSKAVKSFEKEYIINPNLDKYLKDGSKD